MKNKITWNEIPKDDCESLRYDLAGVDENNKRIDIYSTYKGTWSVYYNQVSIRHNFENRDEAKIWTETVDLINELTNKL